MNVNKILNSIRISIPIFLAFISLSLAFFGQHIFDFEEKIGLSPLFGLFTFEYLVTETELRLFCGALAVFFLCCVFLRDYSHFYPRQLTLCARFDNKGLQNLLEKFQKDTRFDFDIYTDWQSKKRDYLKSIEIEILKKTSKNIQIGDGGLLVAMGYTTFVAKKQSLFKQSYRVIEADGQLFMNDEGSKLDFWTLFHLLNTRDADIEVSLGDMLFRFTMLFSPKFSQSYRFNPTEEIRFRDDDFVACTTARFFPWASIGDSIYLVKGKQRWFPVGYCKYDY